MLLGVALRVPNAPPLRPRRIASPQANVKRRKSLLTVKNSDTVFGREIVMSWAVRALQLVVVKHEVVPPIVVAVLLANAPVEQRADRVVLKQRIEESADPVRAPNELALDRWQHVAPALNGVESLGNRLVTVVRHS